MSVREELSKSLLYYTVLVTEISLIVWLCLLEERMDIILTISVFFLLFSFSLDSITYDYSNKQCKVVQQL